MSSNSEWSEDLRSDRTVRRSDCGRFRVHTRAETNGMRLLSLESRGVRRWTETAVCSLLARRLYRGGTPGSTECGLDPEADRAATRNNAAVRTSRYCACRRRGYRLLATRWASVRNTGSMQNHAGNGIAGTRDPVDPATAWTSKGSSARVKSVRHPFPAVAGCEEQVRRRKRLERRLVDGRKRPVDRITPAR
jgi:hypothetical protein